VPSPYRVPQGPPEADKGAPGTRARCVRPPDWERPIPTPAQYVPACACESLSACQARYRGPWTIPSSKGRTPFSPSV